MEALLDFELIELIPFLFAAAQDAIIPSVACLINPWLFDNSISIFSFGLRDRFRRKFA